MKESVILAERVLQKDPLAIDFLFKSLVPACKRNEDLTKLDDTGLRQLFESVIEVWYGDEDPIGSYEFESTKHRKLMTFPDYFFKLLLIAAHVT